MALECVWAIILLLLPESVFLLRPLSVFFYASYLLSGPFHHVMCGHFAAFYSSKTLLLKAYFVWSTFITIWKGEDIAWHKK